MTHADNVLYLIQNNVFTIDGTFKTRDVLDWWVLPSKRITEYDRMTVRRQLTELESKNIIEKVDSIPNKETKWRYVKL